MSGVPHGIKIEMCSILVIFTGGQESNNLRANRSPQVEVKIGSSKTFSCGFQRQCLRISPARRARSVLATLRMDALSSYAWHACSCC